MCILFGLPFANCGSLIGIDIFRRNNAKIGRNPQGGIIAGQIADAIDFLCNRINQAPKYVEVLYILECLRRLAKSIGENRESCFIHSFLMWIGMITDGAFCKASISDNCHVIGTLAKDI